MNALKTVVMLAFLGAVGYVVYLSITKNPRHATDQAAAPLWPSTPKSQLTAPGALVPQLPTAPPTVSTGTPLASPAPLTSPLPAMPPPAATMPDAMVRTLPPPPGSTVPAAGPMTLPPSAATPPSPYASSLPKPPAEMASAALPAAMPGPAGAAPPSPPPADAEMVAQFRALMEAVRARLDEGKLDEGLQRLTEIYEMSSLPDEQQAEVVELLGQVAGTVIYSRQHLLLPPHRVQPGETLDSIAVKYQLTPELLAKINGLDARSPLPPGQELKVIPGPFSAVVRLDRRELVLYVKGMYAGRFPIGLGRDRPLTEEVYGVKDKIFRPAYTGPDRTAAAADDPRNPLGRCLLDLGNDIGIHGTNDPAAIGRDNNRGTISLGDRDLADAYDILTIGSRVTIQR